MSCQRSLDIDPPVGKVSPCGPVGVLINHAHVLLCVAREPDTRLRHIPECVGITERGTHRIITDLTEAGYLTRHLLGRRTYYEVHPELPLRTPLEGDHQVGELFGTLLRRPASPPASGAASG